MYTFTYAGEKHRNQVFSTQGAITHSFHNPTKHPEIWVPSPERWWAGQVAKKQRNLNSALGKTIKEQRFKAHCSDSKYVYIYYQFGIRNHHLVLRDHALKILSRVLPRKQQFSLLQQSHFKADSAMVPGLPILGFTEIPCHKQNCHCLN